MKIAIIIGILLVCAIIGFDIYLALDNIRGNTWSEMLRTASKYTPIVPWTFGVLMGHFFHPATSFSPIVPLNFGVPVLVWISVVLGIVGLALVRSFIFPQWPLLLAGFFAGWLLWPVFDA